MEEEIENKVVVEKLTPQQIKELDIKKRQELDKLFAVDKTNIWGTADYDVFNIRLEKMNIKKLKEMAKEVGIIGEWNEKGLRDSLRKRFKEDKRNFTKTTDMKPHKFELSDEDKKLFNM